jgi:hypothetical protein
MWNVNANLHLSIARAIAIRVHHPEEQFLVCFEEEFFMLLKTTFKSLSVYDGESPCGYITLRRSSSFVVH